MDEILTLISPAEARARLESFDVLGTESVSLEEADGRVLARDLTAPADWPPWARGVMDGYAVRSADLAGASPEAPVELAVVGSVPMGGSYPGAVGPGEAVGITTGGVLPDGADAVVMIEHAELDGARLSVRRRAAAWDNVIRPGEDMRRDEVMVPAGRRLRPQDLGLFAAFGVVSLDVFQRPRVGVVSTGDELAPPSVTPPRGKIRDVNATVLGSQIRRAGGVPVSGGIVSDDEASLRASILRFQESCDLILLSGGSSVGVRDVVERVVVGLEGATVLFHGINVRPGKPTLCARFKGKPIIGMPGHPVSSMVIFDAFVRPLVARLGGEVPFIPWPARRRAVMVRERRKTPGRDEYLRVALGPPQEPGGLPVAEPIPGGSAAFGTVVRADGLVLVSETQDRVLAGDEVEVLLYV